MAELNHPSFPQPSDPAISLWRYVDLSKLLWMLQWKSLYFARADKLGDPFEGHYTKAGKVQLPEFAERQARQTYIGQSQSLEDHIEFWRKALEHIYAQSVESRIESYVSCWHMNDLESSAMWRLYTSLSEAVCIKTSYQKLADCLPKHVFLGVINYIDYERETFNFGNTFSYVMHKRKSFSHEREARAIVWLHDDNYWPERKIGEAGVALPVDLNSLIEAVYVSPSAHPSMLEIIQRLLSDYGIDAPALQSEVNAPPAY